MAPFCYPTQSVILEPARLERSRAYDWHKFDNMRAFLSYQTADKLVAGRISELLKGLGISAFMAHEDIEVSEEWQHRILKEIGEADLFIPILSERYFSSVYCAQESGIAAFKIMTMIPLSIDGTIPHGFLAHIQSTKINPDNPTYLDLLPGLAKRDISFLISAIITIVAGSRSWRGAESNFQLILPYLMEASRQQVVELLTVSNHNKEVCNAGLCAQKYLPPLVKTHGRYMKRKDLRELKDTLTRYGVSF
jgi:hypothetical protein